MPLFEGCPAQRVAFCSRMWWTRGKTRSGEVLGFEGRGAQTRFAKEIRRVPLTPKQRSSLWSAERQLAEKIIATYPSVSTDFLLLGRSGGGLDRKLERRLLQYQKKTGTSVFTS
jgi:hypothetical protein